MLIFQILLILLGPLLAIYLVKWIRLEKWLSPVVLAYGLGIILANISTLPMDKAISTTFSEATILLAIPMLLYATDLRAWFRYAPKTILSFALCVASGVVASLLVAFLFPVTKFDNWMISGMLVGVYTGGIPNMQAIGLALGAEEELYVLMNGADIFCGGIYLLFLTSVAHRFLGWFLPDFEGEKGMQEESPVEAGTKITWRGTGEAFGLTILIIAASVGLTLLVTGALKSSSLIILLLTSFSVLVSFIPRVRAIEGAFEWGEYLLLMFCIAVGLLSDFSEIWNGGGEVVWYTALVLSITVAFHFFLSALFRIDRDTTLITSTAALYGPVFIGQVASSIRNRTLIFSGMATGLVGFAIGNYLGIGVACLLRWWLNV